MSIAPEEIANAFKDRFGAQPELIVRAPGRVNLIGEHTDYNDGFVLPMAIERDTLMAATPRSDGLLRVYAQNLDAFADLDLQYRARNADSPWLDYISGVAEILAQSGRALHGANAVLMGDVPLGCGLSSSAALEMAALELFEALGGYRLEDAEAARLGQRVENQWLGLSSGIMDQFASRCARAGHALFLDCRSLEYRSIPVQFEDAVFVIGNTMVSRGLTASKYNERVAECRRACACLREHVPGAGTALRDFTVEDWASVRESLDETAHRRARHAITENLRTQEASLALEQGDAPGLGQLMNQSDASLREDYEVTCAELDVMTRVACQLPGCLGSRMTGAGFGGCTISLVEREHVGEFCRDLLRGYQARTGLAGEVYVTDAAAGACRLH
ncbi:MAG: galactokinase [Candidatus Hydrogenedentes bacterium]|nr:galactokinase [Candidatus Hydrogenedentota bacterium]